MKQNHRLLAIMVALIIISVPIVSFAQTVKWKFQDTYGAAAWPSLHLNKPLIEWIHKVTNNRIQIAWYNPGALASVGETYDALSKGVFDAASLYPGFYTGVMPEGNVEQGLPWGWTDAKAHTLSLFQFGLFDLMKKVYAKHNIHLLVHYPMGDIYNIGTTKPVTKLDDLKGMKIRAVGVYGDYVKVLGATPVSTPYDEMYMALKMGTVDGFLASAGALISGKLGEVIKYYLLPTTNSIGFVVGVNQKSWDALPGDLKDLLEKTAPQVAVEISALYSGLVDNSLFKASKEYGVKFVTLSEADQQKAIQLSMPIWDNLAAKTPESKQAVDTIKATLQYLGKIK
jgi:TRAP-type C4-dicarboxylate transport system substrate-binding protein